MKAELTATSPTGTGRSAEQRRRTPWPAEPVRLELLVAAGVLALAFAARAWNLAGVGINHFDEGVYVISALGVSDPARGLFPNQVVFSPPFYFGTAGVLHRLLGGSMDRVAIMLNIVLGTFTVGAVWWIARSWFSVRAAGIAATLLALSQFHILFSRVALTDVAFAFWFVLALGTIVVAVERSHFGLAILAGMVTGLAWNTKYHGWFALVITGAALVPTLWAGRRGGTWRRPAAVWLAVCAVAAICYLPWALVMRDASADGGGYGGIVRYFAAMLRGEWLGNLIRHGAQQAWLEGPLSRAAPLAALGIGLLLSLRTSLRASWLAAAAAALALGGLLVGHAGVAVLLGLAALPLLLREFAAYRSRVILCWVGLWVIAAPFYHPYPRLLLPFTIATLILAGAVLDRLLSAAAHRTSVAGGRGSAARSTGGALACLAAAAVVFAVAPALRADVSNPWRATHGHAEAAARISALVPAGQRIIVLGEPSVAYHLQQLGRNVPSNAQPRDLDSLVAPTYLVTGVYVDRAPPLRNRINRMAERLTPLDVIPFDPNDLRLLDDFRPDVARRYRATRDTTFDLSVYRLDF
jgi:dolichyl-phosphate-mannose-protein mannosyltransferase